MYLNLDFLKVINTGIVASGLLMLFPGVSSAINVVNFDENPPNVAPGTTTAPGDTFNQWQSTKRVTFSGNSEILALFDSNCDPDATTGANGGAVPPGCAGNDTDLAVNLGNILIISDNQFTPPGDSANGGTISMLFDLPVIFGLQSIQLVDIESDTPVTINAYSDLAGNNQVATNGPLFTGDGQVSSFDFGSNVNLRRLDVVLAGSGAVGSITYDEVPEPLTILGSATALGFGALFKKKLSQKKPK